MSDKRANYAPTIHNRKAFHDYHIDAKLECGVVLVGSEVKALRLGKANIQEAFARVDGGELILYGLHIDPYDKASYLNHLPLRERKLLVHKRELKRLETETAQKGTTLIPLSIYFKAGKVKIELAVVRGKHLHDKREAIKQKDQKRELRQMTMKRA